MYTRAIEISKSYHCLLFGARGTGKTTLLQERFPKENTYTIDLLNLKTEDRFRRAPDSLAEIVNALPDRITHVVIDEVQKLPKLLDVVHRIIGGGCRIHFILTGSSARKLKKGSANLLAGRAFVRHLYPLSYLELAHSFNLLTYLKYGGLPGVYQFTETADILDYLEAYTFTYLKEEVWAEHLIKDLDPFRNFIEVAAQANGKIVNYARIGRLCGVTTKTAQQYFDILKETHLGILLDAYDTSIRKRIIKAPRFYFIDTGIKRAIENTHTLDLRERTSAFGQAFEHFIIVQAHILNEYRKKRFKFFYLATKDGVEIDLVIEKPDRTLLLVEIKSTDNSLTVELPHFKKLTSDIKDAAAFCVSRDPVKRISGNVTFLDWRTFLDEQFRA